MRDSLTGHCDPRRPGWSCTTDHPRHQAALGAQGDGRRAIVDQMHLHGRPEATTKTTQSVANALVQRLGQFRCRSSGESWTRTAARICAERELTDAEDLAVAEGFVHLAISVLEDPQREDLLDHPIGGSLVVPLLDTQ